MFHVFYCRKIADLEFLARTSAILTSGLPGADALWASLSSDNKANLLEWACAMGRLEVIQGLADLGLNLDLPYKGGGTALGMAATHGQLEVAKCLLKAGAKIDPPGDYVPIILAAVEGHVEMVQFLMESGARVDRVSRLYGPLMGAAAKRGQRAVVEYLVKAGVSLNGPLFKGLSPLSGAAVSGHTAVVRCLVRAGADKNLPVEAPPVLRSFDGASIETVRYLVDAGAEIGRPGEATGGGDILVHAASSGWLEVVKILKKAGADLDRAGAELVWKATPLAAAVRNGHRDVVKYLLSAGASVNKASLDIGASPIHLAAESGNLELVKCLVAAGGDVNQAAPNGFTPLFLAMKDGHAAVELFLRQAGAKAPNLQVLPKVQDSSKYIRSRGAVVFQLIVSLAQACKHGD